MKLIFDTFTLFPALEIGDPQTQESNIEQNNYLKVLEIVKTLKWCWENILQSFVCKLWLPFGLAMQLIAVRI